MISREPKPKQKKQNQNQKKVCFWFLGFHRVKFLCFFGFCFFGVGFVFFGFGFDFLVLVLLFLVLVFWFWFWFFGFGFWPWDSLTIFFCSISVLENCYPETFVGILWYHARPGPRNHNGQAKEVWHVSPSANGYLLANFFLLLTFQ